MKKKLNFNTLLRFLFVKVFVTFNTNFLCMTKKSDGLGNPHYRNTTPPPPPPHTHTHKTLLCIGYYYE